jgi:hypothetical protein
MRVLTIITIIIICGPFFIIFSTTILEGDRWSLSESKGRYSLRLHRIIMMQRSVHFLEKYIRSLQVGIGSEVCSKIGHFHPAGIQIEIPTKSCTQGMSTPKLYID